MTIEMPQSRPFVWPAPIEDFRAWDKERQDLTEKEQEEEHDRRQGPTGQTKQPMDGKTLREQAKELLEGKRRWRAGWEDYGRGMTGE